MSDHSQTSEKKVCAHCRSRQLIRDASFGLLKPSGRFEKGARAGPGRLRPPADPMGLPATYWHMLPAYSQGRKAIPKLASLSLRTPTTPRAQSRPPRSCSNHPAMSKNLYGPKSSAPSTSNTNSPVATSKRMSRMIILLGKHSAIFRGSTFRSFAIATITRTRPPQ